MIIDAYAHIVNSKYFDRLVDKGGKWTQKRLEHFLGTVQKA